MIKKTKIYRKKFHKFSKYKKKKKNHLIYKTFYVLILFSISILLFIDEHNKNYSIQKEIEKEVEKIEPSQKPFTLEDVKNDFESIVNRYKYLIKNEKNIAENCPIWMMWYQGIENASPLILSCIQSVIENRAKHPVIIITKYNIDKYIKLPSYIMEKFNNKTFTLTHFSDIVRVALLFKYGGYWIDATYFVTTPITKVDTTFYTLKLDYCFINSHPFVKCIWSVNYIAVAKNSFFAAFAYHVFLLYWKKYNSLIDILLIDYVVHIAYNNIPEFKNIFYKIPFVPCNIFTLYGKLNSEYKKSDICHFNKFNKKFTYKHTDNIISHYEHLIKNYKFDFHNINRNYILNI